MCGAFTFVSASRSVGRSVPSYRWRGAYHTLHLHGAAVEHVNEHALHAPVVVLPLPEKIVAVDVPAVDEVGPRRRRFRQVLPDGRGAR